ncbi:MAG TPA: hypothetical protein ENN80_13605 [Candidatus Hydrogenedentes bacterium]|nr:hypothetical protein [Candidatus Hydrogenedentota bacterium]
MNLKHVLYATLVIALSLSLYAAKGEEDPPRVEQGAQTPSGDYSRLWEFINGLPDRVRAAFGGATSLSCPMRPSTQEGLDALPMTPSKPTAPSSYMHDYPKTLSIPGKPTVGVETGTPTLVGRPGSARIIEEDGQVRVLTPRQLALVNQPGFRVADLPRPSEALPRGAAGSTSLMAPPAEAEPSAEAEPPVEQGPQVQEPAAEDTAEPTGPNPAAEAKAQDIERIESLRAEQAWFYRPDGVPMTREELDRRLATGDVEGLRAVDRYQQSWSTPDSYDEEAQTR